MADNRSIQIDRNEHNIAIVYSISDECNDGSMQISSDSINIPSTASDWLSLSSIADNRITLKAKSNPNEVDRGTIVTIEPFINGERCSGFNAAQVTIVQKGFGVTCACSSLTSSYLDGLTIPANAMQSYNIYNFDSACKDLFIFEVDGTVEETIKNSDSFNISTKQNTSIFLDNNITIKPYFNNELCNDKVVYIRQLPLAIQTLNCCQFLNKVNLASTTIDASGVTNMPIYEIGNTKCQTAFTPIAYLNGYRVDEDVVKITRSGNNFLATINENSNQFKRTIDIQMYYDGEICEGKNQTFKQLGNASTGTCELIFPIQTSFDVPVSGGTIPVFTVANESDIDSFVYSIEGSINVNDDTIKEGRNVLIKIDPNTRTTPIEGVIVPVLADGNIGTDCTDKGVTIRQAAKTPSEECSGFSCISSDCSVTASNESMRVTIFTASTDAELNAIDLVAYPDGIITSPIVSNGQLSVNVGRNDNPYRRTVSITPKIRATGTLCDFKTCRIVQNGSVTPQDCDNINYINGINTTGISKDSKTLTIYSVTSSNGLTLSAFPTSGMGTTSVTTNNEVVVEILSNTDENQRDVEIVPIINGSDCVGKKFVVKQDGTSTPSACTSFDYFNNQSEISISKEAQTITGYTSSSGNVYSELGINFVYSNPLLVSDSRYGGDGKKLFDIVANNTDEERTITITPSILGVYCNSKVLTIKQAGNTSCDDLQYFDENIITVPRNNQDITAYTSTPSGFTFTVSPSYAVSTQPHYEGNNVVLGINYNGGTTDRVITVTPVGACSGKTFTIDQLGSECGPTPSDEGCGNVTYVNQILYFDEEGYVNGESGQTKALAYKYPTSEASKFTISGAETSWMTISEETSGSDTYRYVSVQPLPSGDTGRTAELDITYNGACCGASRLVDVRQRNLTCKEGDAKVDFEIDSLSACGDTNKLLARVWFDGCKVKETDKASVNITVSPSTVSANTEWKEDGYGYVYIDYPCNTTTADNVCNFTITYSGDTASTTAFTQEHLIRPKINISETYTPIEAGGCSDGDNPQFVGTIHWNDVESGEEFSVDEDWITVTIGSLGENSDNGLNTNTNDALHGNMLFFDVGMYIATTSEEASTFENPRTATLSVGGKPSCANCAEKLVTEFEVQQKLGTVTEDETKRVTSLPSSGDSSWDPIMGVSGMVVAAFDFNFKVEDRFLNDFKTKTTYPDGEDEWILKAQAVDGIGIEPVIRIYVACGENNTGNDRTATIEFYLQEGDNKRTISEFNITQVSS